MSENFKENWWSGGVYFSCLGCGRCCRGEPGAIFVTDEEVRSIMGFLDIQDQITFRRKYMTGRWKHQSIAEKRNGECIFHDLSTNRCSIYPVRPSQCSLFPFWPSVMASRSAWIRHARKCPGMDQGEYFSPERIKQILSMNTFGDL